MYGSCRLPGAHVDEWHMLSETRKRPARGRSTSEISKPDVYQLDNNVYFASLAANDKLGDLTPYIGNQLKLDDYPESALTWAQYNGVQYGVPSGLNGPLFIWNKQIFDEAGVEYPTNDWSWEDFEKACQEIYDKTGK